MDPTVNPSILTATANGSMAAVDIFSGGRGTTRRNARRGPQVSLQERYNIIAIDVTVENGISRSTYLIEITKVAPPPVSGGPLPVFQSASVGDNLSASSSSAAGIGEWKSRLLFAEPLLDGGVRFVFAISAEEFRIEETPDLLGETWRPLPDEEFKMIREIREDNVDSRDRLTVILPAAEGKQRFLRLTTQEILV